MRTHVVGAGPPAGVDPDLGSLILAGDPVQEGWRHSERADAAILSLNLSCVLIEFLIRSSQTCCLADIVLVFGSASLSKILDRVSASALHL